MPFEPQIEELKRRKKHALAMGEPDKVARQHAKGRLTASERIDALLDPGTFLEVGMLNTSDMPGMEDKTPADGKVAGFGKINERDVALVSNDFTVLASTSSRVAGHKDAEVRFQAAHRGIPVVYLADAGGARMPDIMGAKGMASFGGGGFDTFLRYDYVTRVRKTPMATGVMGTCYGMPMWMACLADFVVQVRGATMAVSGPRVLGLALSEETTDEELGGCAVHSEITGITDRVAGSEEECLQLIRTYLSYMPSHCGEAPPDAPVPEGSGSSMPRILECLPEQRNRTYDMQRVLQCIVDTGSLFELKPHFGRSVITALARIKGKVVGIIANQPLVQVGAMDGDGIDKVVSFMCLCDSFNVPLLFLHDIPGFLVGKEAEQRRVAAKVITYMNALAQLTVPKISIIVRKSYGMAFQNMAGTGCGADFLVAWPTAEISFMEPETAANVKFGGKVPASGKEREEWEGYVQQMVKDTSPYGPAGLHYLHDVIDPRETRDYIHRTLEISLNRFSNGIGQHKLANWPTKF